MNTTKTIDSMAAIIKEYKEYQAMAKALEEEMAKLKAEAIELLEAEEIDEYMCETGKVTYRERISQRFQSTEFKKIHGDLYAAFSKPTSSMFFTCN